MAKRIGVIYLLHFSTPYHHAKHYVGFTTDLDARIDAHQRGAGARLLEVIGAAGIGFSLARTWSGTRNDERAIKNRKAAPRLCPTCNPNNRRALTPGNA
jgi:predicted GIY-YIG superfamily endonuclease